jgi:hypothetical protein
MALARTVKPRRFLSAFSKFKGSNMTWDALTDEDRDAVLASMPGAIDGFLKDWGWEQFAMAIEARCREKNEFPEQAEAEFDVVADGQHCAGAAGPLEQALAEARNYALQYLGESRVVHIEEVRRVVVERFERVPLETFNAMGRAPISGE